MTLVGSFGFWGTFRVGGQLSGMKFLQQALAFVIVVSRVLLVHFMLSGMFAIRAERDYVVDEDFMKAVRKVADNKKLESKLDYKPL